MIVNDANGTEGQWEVTRELITNNKVLKCECDSFHELDHIRNLYTNITLTYLLS